ncbi:MAG: glycerophosphodiester phosphodiesterase family protein, partial [Balneolaceae bacterium]
RKVATLEEFLQATKNRVQLLIEIKSYRPDPGVAEAVIKLVQDHEMENEVMIMSPNLDIVNRLNTLAPGLRIGFVTAVSVGNLSRIPVDFLAVNHNRINPELIQSVRSQDILLFAWTVNSATTMADMIELDVDGIITDDPELAVKVRNELMEMSVTERLLLRFRQLVIDDENSEE